MIKELALKLSDNNRLKKYNLFIDYLKPDNRTKVLDIGASEKEYQQYANII